MALNPNKHNYYNYGSTSGDTEVIIPTNNSREITTICDNVSTNIYTVNSCIKNLKSVNVLIGTSRDGQGMRDQIHVWQLSANEVVKATPPIINKLNMLARTANKPQKLQITKITSHFKEAVQDYSIIQREVADKLRTHLLQSPEALGQSTSEADSLLEQDQLQVQQNNLKFEQELLLERQNRIKAIESDILDVNQLMKDLSGLVHEQGSAIDSIENSVEVAHVNVELGQQQLAQASSYQTKMRKRNLCLFLGLTVVLSVLLGIIIWAASS